MSGDGYDSLNDKYLLVIDWPTGHLPGFVGPFDSRRELEEWARLNVTSVVDGARWRIEYLTYPYLRSGGGAP